MSPTLRTFVEQYIAGAVQHAGGQTPYRPPLVGFADAADPAWPLLRQIAEPTHLLPADLLPGARTVVAFFIPFGEAVVRANRRAPVVAPEWVVAYRETNALINRILQGLATALGRRGVRAASAPATYNFDPLSLVSSWSHKSAAAIAGLGSFGLHRMLITDLGCAGRCGSLAIDAPVPPTDASLRERCTVFAGGRCTFCVDHCPPGALRLAPAGEMNLDKHRCWDYILGIKEPPEADCCGKCATGPCALASAVP
jgi:epoxyqueuosine reductase